MHGRSADLPVSLVGLKVAFDGAHDTGNFTQFSGHAIARHRIVFVVSAASHLSRSEPLSSGEAVIACVAVVLGVVLYLWQLDATPVQCGNEAMYIYPPILMLQTGDFLVPHYAHGPFIDKPPLSYWLIAASYRLLGISVTAARLPGAIAALATVAIVGFWVRRRFGIRAAVLSALALLYSLKFAAFARLFAADTLLTFAVTLAVISLDSAVRREGSDLPLGAGSGAALALAFGFKGLIGIVLPVGAVAVGLLLDRVRPVRLLRRTAAAALAAALILAPWHWAMTRRFGFAFWKYFYWTNHFQRATSALYNAGHVRGPLYYVGQLAAGMFPWIVFLPLAFVKPRSSGVAVGWLLFGLVVLSSVVMKREVYVMPLFPAVAMLVGEVLAGKLSRAWTVRLLWLVVSGAALVGLVGWVRMGGYLPGLVGRTVFFGLGAGVVLLVIVSGAGAILPERKLLPLLLGISCGALFVALLKVETRLARFDPFPAWGDTVRLACSGDCRAYRLGVGCNSLDYYSRREWFPLRHARDLLGKIPPQGAFLILREGAEREFQTLGFQVQPIERRLWLEENWAKVSLSKNHTGLVPLLFVRLGDAEPARPGASREP
jgi:4-amino-4-deoxy-L-arabinose transferase-like glycosyltransferase